MKLYLLHTNIEWKLANKWVITWFSKNKEGPILSYNISKIPNVLPKKSIHLSKFKFEKGLKPKTHIFGLFGDKPLRWSQTPKKGYNMFADFKLCIKYKDFVNLVKVGDQSEIKVY